MDEMDQQQEIEDRNKKKMLVNEDTMKDARKSVKDSKKEVVND